MVTPNNTLTGKVFVGSWFDDYTAIENDSFQLEAMLDGQVTRLQADVPVPEDCFYDKRHSGLEIKRVLEKFPPKYVVGCNCGYEVTMTDVNEGFRYRNDFKKDNFKE